MFLTYKTGALTVSRIRLLHAYVTTIHKTFPVKVQTIKLVLSDKKAIRIK